MGDAFWMAYGIAAIVLSVAVVYGDRKAAWYPVAFRTLAAWVALKAGFHVYQIMYEIAL
jgi:hypothetical protein